MESVRQLNEEYLLKKANEIIHFRSMTEPISLSLNTAFCHPIEGYDYWIAEPNGHDNHMLQNQLNFIIIAVLNQTAVDFHDFFYFSF